MTEAPALVLVAMGIDASVRAGELRELAETLGASLAYLQGAEPTLTAELDRISASGARSITVARVPVGISPPSQSWLTRVVAAWRTQHPDTTVTVRGREIAASDTLTSPAWEEVPRHAKHVLVCRGPRCAARGSADTAASLAQAMTEHQLGDDDVLVTQTGCLFPCNHAPVVVVHPDDSWFGPVRAGDAPALVEHLIGGRELGPLLDRSPQPLRRNSQPMIDGVS